MLGAILVLSIVSPFGAKPIAAICYQSKGKKRIFGDAAGHVGG
jgi:hypothetical protein